APTTAPRGERSTTVSHERTAPEHAGGIDRTTALGAAVALLALAGVCALLGGHFVLGVLRLAAGVLAGAGLGAALSAVLPARLAARPRLLVAAGTALAAPRPLPAPAVIATRVDPLADRAEVALEPLAEGDAVHSLPAAGSPVMVRRADGPAEVLIDGVAHRVDASAHDVLA